MRHAADGIRGRIAQVDVTIAIEVHRIFHDAARHELGQADGARVGAEQGQRIDAILAREQQRVFQFALEKFHACRARRAFRIGKCQGGQRVEHAEASCVAAIHGFHADDADDDLGRHAILAFGALQRLRIFFPKFHARIDAHRLDEAGAVGLPVLRLAGRRRFHQLHRRFHIAHLADQRVQFGTVKAMLGGHVVEEGADLFPVGIVDKLAFEVELRRRFLCGRFAGSLFDGLGLGRAHGLGTVGGRNIAVFAGMHVGQAQGKGEQQGQGGVFDR
ncbi:hypothetical protein D3C81_581670 [compost metagenome]